MANRLLCYTVCEMSTKTTPAPVAAPTPNFWPFLISLAAVAGLAELAYAIVGVSELSVYLQDGLGLTGIVGASFGAFYLAEAVLNSPMGTLADRIGRRRLMVLGALASVITCTGLAFLRVPSFAGGAFVAGGAVLAMRLLDGAGAAALWPAVFASVGDRVQESRRATAMSALTVTYFGGIALGPLVGGYANERWGRLYSVNEPRHYMPSLLIAAALFAITACAAYFIAPSGRQTRDQTPPGGDGVGLNPLAQSAVAGGEIAQSPDPAHEHGVFSLVALANTAKRFPFLMLLAFATFMAVGLIIPYVKIFAQDRFNVTETGFAHLLLYPALVIGLLAVPSGRLADKVGKVIAVRGGMGVCAAALWIMVSIHHKSAVIAGGALLGLGFLFAFPAYMAFLSDLTGPTERGGTLGAIRAAQGVGALVGTLFSSLLFTRVGPDAPFHAAAALLTLAFAMSMIYIKPIAPAADDPLAAA